MKRNSSKAFCILLTVCLLMPLFGSLAYADEADESALQPEITLIEVYAGLASIEEYYAQFGDGAVPMTASLASEQTLDTGVYYFNNAYWGMYMQKAYSFVSGASGLISNLGTSIQWNVTWDSTFNAYYITNATNPTQYLSASTSSSSNTVYYETVSSPSQLLGNNLWHITNAAGGGMLIQNAYNGRYLHLPGADVYTTASTGDINTAEYKKCVWRSISTEYYGNTDSHTYRELNSFTVGNVSIDIGEPTDPEINANSNALWVDANDFTYSTSDYYYADPMTGSISGSMEGTVSVTAFHQVTGKTATFRITVSGFPAATTCYEGTTVDLKISVGNNCSAFNNAIWNSSNTSVATVNNYGVVTAKSSGYTFISATNGEGKIVLMCELKVTSEITDMIRNFTSNEIEYLYCPTSYLNNMTVGLGNEGFEQKVRIINALRPYYMRPMDQHPERGEIRQILIDEVNLIINDYELVDGIFYECYLGYQGLYNQEYLTELRIEYFNYLKEIVLFCAASMASNLDPVNTGSNCHGYDDLAYDLSKEWGHNESNNKVMLGSYGYEQIYYNNVAERYGYGYFYSPDHSYYRSMYGDDFVRSVNMRYLQRMLERNCTFYFCSDPRTAPISSSLHAEYTYLYNYYQEKWGTVYLLFDSSLKFWYFSSSL